MLQRSGVAIWLCLVLGAGLAWAPPAAAQDDDEEEELDLSYIGGRLGVWYRPQMEMEVQTSNTGVQLPGGGVLIGSSINIRDDLGVKGNPNSDYMFRQGILEAEFFVDSRWATLSLWGVAPFAYEGDATLTRTINFAGVEFSASTPVESRFEQFLFAADLRMHLLNNEFVRVSPILGARALGIDWQIKALPGGGTSPITADTSDIDSPFSFGDDQVLPYPEVGLEVRVGYRELIEVDAKLTGMYVTWSGYEGGTLMLDAGVTVYPVDFLGVRAGVRHVDLDFKDRESEDTDGHYDLRLELVGFTAGVLVRFG